jgi:hypothetical protein
MHLQGTCTPSQTESKVCTWVNLSCMKIPTSSVYVFRQPTSTLMEMPGKCAHSCRTPAAAGRKSSEVAIDSTDRRPLPVPHMPSSFTSVPSGNTPSSSCSMPPFEVWSDGVSSFDMLSDLPIYMLLLPVMIARLRCKQMIMKPHVRVQAAVGDLRSQAGAELSHARSHGRPRLQRLLVLSMQQRKTSNMGLQHNASGGISNCNLQSA